MDWTTPGGTETCRMWVCWTLRCIRQLTIWRTRAAGSVFGHGKASILAMEASSCLEGGDGGTRTPDLYSAIVALSQLSYVPSAGERDYKRIGRLWSMRLATVR